MLFIDFHLYELLYTYPFIKKKNKVENRVINQTMQSNRVLVKDNHKRPLTLVYSKKRIIIKSRKF